VGEQSGFGLRHASSRTPRPEFAQSPFPQDVLTTQPVWAMEENRPPPIIQEMSGNQVQLLCLSLPPIERLLFAPPFAGQQAVRIRDRK